MNNNHKNIKADEIIDEALKAFGFTFPTTHKELEDFDNTSSDYNYTLTGHEVSPQDIIQEINDEKAKKPTSIDFYMRILLVGEIVHKLHQSRTLGNLKLQKLIYLCQKRASLNLPLQFLKQEHGPYDPKLARSIHKQLSIKEWFRFNGTKEYKFEPLSNAGKHREDYDKYFSESKHVIDNVINTFRNERSEGVEIVATLYDCWERLLEQKKEITNSTLFEQFYDWSESKNEIPKYRVQQKLEWMINTGFHP
jgi:uncharacterized protein YwgA